MTLPFTIDQFLSVFAAYNAGVWPMQVLLVVPMCFIIQRKIIQVPGKKPYKTGWM